MPAQRGIQRDLADGDAHASGPLVTQTQNALTVADDDRTELHHNAVMR